MSFYRVNPGDIESFTVVTNPIRTYVSSSTTGATGSVNVFARRSTIEKEVQPLASFVESAHNDADIASALTALQQLGRYAHVSGSSSTFVQSASLAFPGMLADYLSRVNAQGQSARKLKAVDIIRFTPTTSFTEDTVRKLVIKDVLSKYYRVSYPSAHWAYTNYNSLNFFTSSTVPTSSCLLYPNIDGGPTHSGFVSGVYAPSGAISFDFYINPRYAPDQADGSFKAGTIFHLSSCYALSLVSGSAKDANGRAAGYRLQLQLSHSADVSPSVASRGTYPSDLVFLSDDNSLQRNCWHHVVVRWGTLNINGGTGSFNIDAVDRGTFVVPSGTIAPRLFPTGGKSGPNVLVVGNYYSGPNSGTGSMSYFFAADPALREGLQELIGVAGVDEPNPSSYRFDHPLNAELHDLSIKRYYMSDTDILASASAGPKSIDDNEIAFYLPPFFVKDAPFRQSVSGRGGVPQTPFFETNGTTDDPFNVALSFGVNGHYVNIENFLRDFAGNVFPRAHHMSATILTSTTDASPANTFLYNQPFVRRRNLLLLPCDDGNFVPSYELLASESLRGSYVDDLGVEELSFIGLDDLLSTSSLLFGADDVDDFTNEMVGFTPEQPGLAAGPAFRNHVRRVASLVSSGTFTAGVQDGAPLAVFQRTRDPSSNQVVFFDISNLFYGKRILPGSLSITDNALTGSGGAVNVTLRDDGRGTLFRANSSTVTASWNAVGTVFYDEGLVAIKSPHLYFFGKEGYQFSFRGDQSVHVMRVDVMAPANQMNSSSNPCFKAVPPSPFPNDPDKEFVYVSGINFHDADFNVVMKTQLAQPIIKRHGDRLLFRVKHDF